MGDISEAERELYWPCYGDEEGRHPPKHGYIVADPGFVPEEALPGSRPMSEVAAMLWVGEYISQLQNDDK